MKYAIVILALLSPIFAFTQLDEVKPKKNTIGISTLLSPGDIGISMDYRRTLKQNNEVIVGFHTTDLNNWGSTFGYRRFLNKENDLYFAIGFDADFKQRNSDNLFTAFRVWNVPRVKLFSARPVGGIYYKFGSKVDLMMEYRVGGVLRGPFLGEAPSSMKAGIKYNF